MREAAAAAAVAEAADGDPEEPVGVAVEPGAIGDVTAVFKLKSVMEDAIFLCFTSLFFTQILTSRRKSICFEAVPKGSTHNVML